MWTHKNNVEIKDQIRDLNHTKDSWKGVCDYIKVSVII